MPWVIIGYKLIEGNRVPIRRWQEPIPRKKSRSRRRSQEARRRRQLALARQQARRRAARARAEARARRLRAQARARALRRAAELKAKAKAAAAARMKAEAERRRREAQELYQQKLAGARRTAYKNLQDRQSELVRTRGIVRDGQDQIDPAQRRAAAIRTVRVAQQKAAARKAAEIKVRADELRRQEALRRLTGGNRTVRGGVRRAGSYDPKATGGVKTSRDASDVERLINQEIDRAKTGRGTSPENVRKLQEQYEKYAGGVYEDYKAKVAKLNALLERAKQGDQAAYKAAKTLYYGEFSKSRKEFSRLFGDGKNPLKDGAYGRLYQQLDKLALNQREWWKSQMKASLQQELNTLQRRARQDPGSGGAQKEISELKKQIGWFNEDPKALGQVIDHYETWTGPDGKEHSRPVYRARTLEEAIEAQRAQIKVEEQRQWNARREHMVKLKAALMREGRLDEGLRGEAMLSADGRVIDKATMDFEADLFRARDEIWAGEMPPIKNPNDVQNVANDLLRRWEAKHPQPKGRGPAQREYLKWKASRDAYERRVYAYLGSDVPGFLERVMTAPGITQGLAILQGGTSAIGALGRVLNTAAFGEATVGGINVTWRDLPPAKQEIYRSKGRAGYAWFQRYIQGEGKAWYDAVLAQKRAQDTAEVREFQEGFYNTDDAAQRLEALNKFGSEPFGDPGVNLLFQLLVDPTNAIPLKFTTYAARGLYAAGLAKGANKANPGVWFKSAKNFLTVDEGTLSLQRGLRKFDAELRKYGTNFEDAADELRQQLIGAKSASDMAKRYQAFARKYGIDPEEISESGLGNLTELTVTDALRERGGNLFSQADISKNLRDAKASLDEAARKARKAEQAAARAKVSASQDEALDQGRGAQERLAIQRVEQTEKLKSQADAGAGPQAAAAEPASGKPVPPAKPKTPPGRSSQPGPAEPALAKVHEKVLPRKRPTYKVYESYSEHYTKDRLGNVIPRDPVVRAAFEKTPEYRALMKKAVAGDEGAIAEVSHIAQQMGHAWRMTVEDFQSVKQSGFTPTPYDIAVRAGTWGDEEATRIVMKNREIVREVRRAAGRGNDEYAASFVQKNTYEGDDDLLLPEPIERLDAPLVDDAALRFDKSMIGEDVLAGRKDGGFRQMHDLYEPFTHRVLPLYAKSKGIWPKLADPKWANDKMTISQFGKLVETLENGPSGPVAWRDGGFALFEMFHQLRRAGNLEKLKVLSQYMDEVLVDDPTALYAMMWKVMEVRSGLPWAGLEEVVNTSFLTAAKTSGLDPHLALSSIPNGYYAQRPPRTFDLSPMLRDLGDSDQFLPAPASWNQRTALTTITDIFTRNVGEPMQVVHYAARRFGDFRKGTPLMNRITGELGFKLQELVGEDAMVEIMLRHVGSDLTDFAARRGEQTEVFIRREIKNSIRKFSNGRTKGVLRPDYPNLRDAIQSAYWAGEIPVASARVHELMYLARLQDSGGLRDALVGPTRQFQKYMNQIGAADQGREFLRAIHTERLSRLSGTYAALVGPGRQAADSLMNRETWRMWREMGFKPDDVRLRGHRNQIKQIRRQAKEYEDSQMRRQSWVADEHQKPSDAYTGVVSKEQVDDLLITAHKAEKLDELRAPVLGLIRRISDNGALLGGGDDMLTAVSGLVEQIKRFGDPGIQFIEKLTDEIGAGLLDDAVAQGPELKSWYESALRVQLRVLEDGSGKVLPGMLGLHTKAQLALEELLSRKTTKSASHRIDLSKLAEQQEALPVSDPARRIDIDPNPAPQSTRAASSGAGELLRRISGMTEEQYWTYAKQRAYKTLKSKRASEESKRAARKAIRDVELAEYARQIDEMRGTRIHWTQRANVRDRVLKEYGKDAEKYISPNMIAPYARDAYGASVERVRTWYRQLRNAPPGSASSRTRGLGPKRPEDHFPIALFEKVEQEVAAAIREVRGWGADSLTRARGSREELEQINAEIHASRFADKDPEILAAKQEVLNKYGIDVVAYDEARKVLWKGYIQKRTNEWLIARADKIVDKAKQLGVKNPDWDKAYLAVRQQQAAKEARRQLGKLASGELYGVEPQGVFDEFVARYTDDGNLRRQAHPLSDFQRKTLQEAVKHEAGLENLNEPEALAQFLQSANMPPALIGDKVSRTSTRDWLVKHGMWSPRKAEDFRLGKQSWSIDQEADYWLSSFGVVPPWADRELLAGEKGGIFHNDQMYYEQMREWGVFSRSDDLKARAAGEDAKTIEARNIHGDPMTGKAPRREIAEQRRYVMERYGDLVTDDGVHLKAMPWLMDEGEMRQYLAKMAADEGIPGIAHNAEELTELVRLIEEEMEPLITKLLNERAGARAAGGKGAPITYEDIFEISSQVQARLLADPKWYRRSRDLVGAGLNKWAGLNRWLIFSNPAFMVMNVVDTPIKGGWYRMTRTGLFQPGLHGVDPAIVAKAKKLGAAEWGLDQQTTLYAEKQRRAASYWKNPRTHGMRRVLDSATVPFRLIPETAGRAEIAMKVKLAQEMYPQVYAEAFAKFGDDNLADAWSRKFIFDEVNRMWPTVGNDPVAKLVNRLIPFFSYSIKNKLLFLSEALAHPSILNKIDYIGRYVEQENLKNWEQDHPGEEMPQNLRRMIELPWAEGYYLDIGQFSDATRGLKPLYNMGEQTTVLDYASSWVRIINPGAQAGIYAITNAIGLTRRTMYVPVLDENGFPTGQYRLIETGWSEPWSSEQPDLASIFWFVDAAKSALEYMDDGFTAGELSQALGQVFLFNAIKTYDRETAVFGFYKLMQAKNRDAALAWLNGTPQGLRLKAWMTEKAGSPREAINALQDLERSLAELPWFKLDEAERAEITSARDEIRSIREVYAARLASTQYGSAEYRSLKAQMYYMINEVYLRNPALIKNEVWGKTPAQWASQLEEWQTDKLLDDYMALNGQRPSRANFKTSAAYTKAVEEWESAKKLFLKTYPQVERALAGGITQLDAVRDRMNKDWDDILKRIAARNEEIERAKAIIAEVGRATARGSAAQDRLDILYIQNDLDFSLLEKDYAAVYFQKEDYQKLPFGIEGPTQLQKGISLPRFTVLNDFDRARYEKAVREGRLDEFLAKEQYGKDMKKAILYAKGGDVFGEFNGKKFFEYMNQNPRLRSKYFANNPGKETQWRRSSRYVEGIRNAIAAANKGGGLAFVKYLKARPWLLEEYFKRHPEKRREWAANDAYIRSISVWGKLVGKGDWDAAEQAWESLPQWVRDRYLRTHPDSKMGDGAKGSAFQFDGKFFKSAESMQRYIDGRARGKQTTTYLSYMDRWVKLFEAGDKERAMRYFNSLPQWAKDRYFKKHPENKARFTTSAAMFEKARRYFAADQSGQTKFLQENQDFAKWLAANGSTAEQQRFAILAAYRSIPKEEAWLRRVFREKYPEVFSVEALGERKLQKVFATLSKHPDLSDDFEKWVSQIWGSYEEMLRKGVPRPLSSYFHTERDVPARKFRKSLSATQSSR
jgi:hypothetical protein